MTRGPKILTWTLAILALLLAVAVILIATFDWNRLRPFLNDKVSQALGRPFAINGDLQVQWAREPEEGGWRAWVPWPHFYAHDITLANPDWAESAEFASLDRMDFRLAPLPLLVRTVRVPRIHLAGPDAHLQRLADGRATWDFELPESDGEPSAWQLDIGTVSFDRALVVLQDEVSKADVELTVSPLGAPIAFSELAGGAFAGDAKPQEEDQAKGEKASAAEPVSPGDYAFGWQAKGRYQGMPVRGEGKVGGLLALQGGAEPFPLQAEVAAGYTNIALAGTLTDPLALAALDLRLKISGRTMSELFPLTGITLPDTPPYSTDGRLRARLGEDGSTFDYSGFSGRVGKSDLGGDIRFVSGPGRPKLSGKLVSQQLRLADLGPLVGADTGDGDGGEKPAGKDEPGAGQPAGKVLPVQEFRTERWDAMDADVTFTGKRIVHSEKLPLSDLSTHLVMDNGVLTLDPLRFGVAGGNLNATLRLDGSRTPMRARARLAARGFKLKQLVPDFEPMQTSLGELNGDAALTGTGNSVAALLASGDGELKLLVNDGTISRGLTEIAGLNVANYVVTKLFGDDEVRINCAATDMVMQQGVMQTRVALFDTENALVEVEGTIDFRKEALDLDIRPHSKGIRIISLRSPLYVRGTFADPQAGVQTGPLIARGAGMVVLGALVTPVAGLLALIAPGDSDKEHQCGAMLEQMRKPPKAQ